MENIETTNEEQRTTNDERRTTKKEQRHTEAIAVLAVQLVPAQSHRIESYVLQVLCSQYYKYNNVLEVHLCERTSTE